MAVILKGKEVAQAKKPGIMERVRTLKTMDICPALNIVMVGDREDAHAYTKGASKALSACGIGCHAANFPEDIKQDKLLKRISAMNNDPLVHGILVMRPIPRSIEWNAVERVISPDKDVDCITTHNLSRIFKGEQGGFNPCTAQAVIEVLAHYGVSVEGKKVAVIGRSLVVGKPVAMLLLQKNATVTICHSKTTRLDRITSAADIIVAAAGMPGLIGAEHVKKGSIVLDVGINMVGGKLVGDVDYDRAAQYAAMITPVPGGIGSVTTSVLMENILTAAERLAGKPG
jgi:methylenetetrahydrofolate dehydrogenase (NADP+)/methenyltetrahydrofolate cyclohydrolase